MKNEPINVTCAIIFKDSKILVAQRSEEMSLPLKWEFPGGKIKTNETEEECLSREIKEELNININVSRRLNASVFDYGHVIINLIPFICFYSSGDIFLAEHKEVKWIAREHLLTLDWAPADIPILNQLFNDE